jgi:gas vesicle structural protein
MSAMSSQRFPRSGYVTRGSSSGLADVLDVLLDKGLVIDIFLRVSLVGIELLTVDARIVIASVDTYLRFAEAVNRLDIGESSSEGLPQLIQDMTQDGASNKTKGVLEGAKESLFGSSREDEDEDEDNDDDNSGNGGGSSRRSRSSSGSGSGSRSRSRAKSSSSSRGR